MNLSVTFRRAARAEFIEAAAWYESQRPGLGVEFIAEIERCVDAAAERPTTYAGVKLASLRGESSNQLLETLEEWNDYLER
jgi:hypothetical protein